MPKIYLSHYGEVCSLSKEDAIQVAKDALDPNKPEGYNLENYPSTRTLKGVSSSRERCGFYQNRKWRHVYHCLDWTHEEWEDFLKELSEEN